MAAVKGTLKADYKGVKWAGTTLSPTGIAKQLRGVSIAKVTGIGQRPIVVNTLVIDQVGGWRASVTSPASAAPALPELEQKWGPTQQ